MSMRPFTPDVSLKVLVSGKGFSSWKTGQRWLLYVTLSESAQFHLLAQLASANACCPTETSRDGERITEAKECSGSENLFVQVQGQRLSVAALSSCSLAGAVQWATQDSKKRALRAEDVSTLSRLAQIANTLRCLRFSPLNLCYLVVESKVA